ncbi:UNVERIFIED_CONTAM: hypothetical protein RMT77_002800 [Armadillidium vulgare]
MRAVMIAQNLVIVVAIYSLQFSNASSSEINQSLEDDLFIIGDIIIPPNRVLKLPIAGKPWKRGIIPFEFLRDTSSRLINQSLDYDLHILGDIIIRPYRKRKVPKRKVKKESGFIPFEFKRCAYGSDEEALIRDIMHQFYDLTNGCVEFVERTNETSYLLIISHDFSAATIGYDERFNIFAMNSNYMDNATILHGLYHILGFEHEQCRTDRNEYVTVLYENIYGAEYLNFNEVYDADVLKVPYDYESIAHFPEFASSKNGKSTIITKDKKYQKIIGTKEVLSEKDILKIKKKYKCE